MKKSIEELSLRMVTAVNESRVNYLQSIKASREGDFMRAERYITQGDERYADGHATHVELLQMEASGLVESVNLLLLHAEDQLVSAETYKVFALEALHLYQELQALKDK